MSDTNQITPKPENIRCYDRCAIFGPQSRDILITQARTIKLGFDPEKDLKATGYNEQCKELCQIIDEYLYGKGTEEASVELTTLPNACFSSKPEQMTTNAIDRICEQGYLQMLANPAYLFVSKQDEETLREDVMKHCNARGLPSGEQSPMIRLTRLVNQTTGRLMHVIVLPDHTPGLLIFGFLESGVNSL